MTLNCTRKQFEALHHLFKTIMAEQPKDIQASLAKDLLQPIFFKLETRIGVRLQGKRSWNLTLTPLQAKAYYTFFDAMDFGEQWFWEGIIIGGHLEQIEKAFG